MVPALCSPVLGAYAHPLLPLPCRRCSHYLTNEDQNLKIEYLIYEKNMLMGKNCLLREQLNIKPDFDF